MKEVYGVPLLNLKVLPEQMIIDAADKFYEEDPDNSFVRLLDTAEEFRDAGLTPVFLSDNNMNQLCVTTRERLRREYH